MVLAKSKNAVGLGNTLMNDRFGKGKGADRRRAAATAVTRVNHSTGEEYIVNDRAEASWVKMRSVTEQGALDEFLATAELAGTDFTAEKMNNVKIVHTDQKNPYLLSAAEEHRVLGKQRENRARLAVPRRPRWDESTTPAELDRRERDAFLAWRRGLAELQENQDLLMTPFERNLEIWRQLWRVIERSDVVVQIVDARNPLMFRSEDLEAYVQDVDPRKQNLLLINKADMMTYNQRKAWANYLKGANIAYKFFSASLAKEYIEKRDLAFDDDDDDDDEEEEEEEDQEDEGEDEEEEEEVGEDDQRDEKAEEANEAEEESAEEAETGDEELNHEAPKDSKEDEDLDTRILTVDELESIFLQYAPEDQDGDRKLQVGLVGYPNVGKSSTINALVGAKKVSVSSTPGKTKHFQTIHLSDKVILCDCPGLVFPNFASTKAELVCNGVLPIDQLREYTGPAALVARRIPKSFLEAVYGIDIRMRPLEEGGTGVPTAEELLTAYARHRGFMTQGLGQPDQSRAVRYVLKDYVAGKLLYCEPPPGGPDGAEFNRELYDLAHLPAKRRLALAAAMEAMSVDGDDDDNDNNDNDNVSLSLNSSLSRPSQQQQQQRPANKSERLDRSFFQQSGAGNAGHLSRPFNHKYTEQGQQQAVLAGKQLSGRKVRALVALETGVDPKDVVLATGKKHFKGGRKGKGKGKKAADDD